MILGAGGMGREAAAWTLDALDDGADTVPVGFVDDAPHLRGTEVGGLEVLGGTDWLARHPSVGVVPAVGATLARRTVLTRLQGLANPLVTVVHPTAHIGRRVELGAGCIVCPQAVLTVDIRLGDAVIVNFGAVVGHDGRIGSYVNIGPNAAVAGNVTIDEGADVGIGSSVVQGRRIGAWTVVGAGAVVARDLPPAVTAVGVPARPRVADVRAVP